MKKASLNHAYRLVWSSINNSFIAVAEHTKSRGKSGGRKLLLLAALLTPAFALADQTGGSVTSGVGSINKDGNITTINQFSQKLGINWDTFNINQDQTVNFVQPNSQSLAVNTISDVNGSKILGNLNSNGQVWLINPNGVFFGQNAQVNVGSLLASTLNPLSADGDSKQTFGGDGKGSIINQGSIKTLDGGYVALLGNRVSNEGVITAKLGAVALAGGSKVSLTFNENSLTKIEVDESTLNNMVENKQLIKADGGLVYMTAGAKDSLLASVVNNTGTIEAKGIENKSGKIMLMGGMKTGTTNVSGTLDASSEVGDGGFVETSANDVRVADGVQVSTLAHDGLGVTGEWLIDPTDYYIAASGGNITGATLSSNLATTNMTIATLASGSGLGDIYVNDAVTWSSARTLTLSAHNNIYVNSSISSNTTSTTSGAGAINFYVGQATTNNSGGSNFYFSSLGDPTVNYGSIGANKFNTKYGTSGTINNFYVILGLGASTSTTGTDLQGMRGSMTRNYALGANIDASVTSGWNSGSGFTPIGSSSAVYVGSFTGLGHNISNLTINRPTMSDVGLFGYKTGGIINDLKLSNASVTGFSYVGGVVGRTNSVQLKDVSLNGTIVGKDDYTGGIAGDITASDLINVKSSGTVTGQRSTGSTVGGLVGVARSSSFVRSSSFSSATVSSTAHGSNGGLVGYLSNSTISNSSSSGNVSATVNGTSGSNVGGLAGVADNSATINNSASSATVRGVSYSNIGGIVGALTATSQVNSSTATGEVQATGTGNSVGGIVGVLSNSQVNSSTANNSLIGSTSTTSSNIGGIVGYLTNSGQVNGSTSNTVATANGGSSIGGIVGGMDGGLVQGSNASITLNGRNTQNNMGGLIGTLNGGTLGASTEANTANVVTQNIGSNSNVGGGVGYFINGTIGSGNNSLGTINTTGTSDGLNVGGFAGYVASGRSLSGVYSSVNLNVIGSNNTNDVGGLVGESFGAISYSYATGAINSTLAGSSGGLIGYESGGSVVGSYAKGNVTNTGYQTGGLVGINVSGTSIQSSYATGNVSGYQNSGGLVGVNKGAISNTFATGSVNSSFTSAGGLVGHNYGGSSITNSYATGNVSGGSNVGGLIAILGDNEGGTVNSVTNTYATGTVTSTGSAKGGLVGVKVSGNDINMSNFWNTQTTGQSTSAGGGVGKTTAQMQSSSTFSNEGWNISTYGGSGTWRIYEGLTGPMLRNFMTVSDVGTSSDVTYNGNTQTMTSVLPSGLDSTKVFGSATASGKNAGIYYSYYSNQFGYDFTDGALTITPKALNVSTTITGTKVYDGNNIFTADKLVLNGLANGETLTVSGFGTTADKNVGTNKDLSLSNIVISDGTGSAANYSFGTTGKVSITAKNLTASYVANDKVYDGNSSATGVLGLSGVVEGDAVSASGSAAFDNKNAGNNKVVTVNGIALSGVDALNYSVNSTATDLADVGKKTIIANLTANDKVYDANTNATGSVDLSGVVVGDVVGSSNTSMTFADKNAGTNKVVTVSGIALSGADADNYNVNSTASDTANINQKSLTASYIANDKVYDGSVNATGSLGLSGVVLGDNVSVSNSEATFDNKNAGTNKVVTVNGIALSGVDAVNYTVNNTTYTTGAIAAKNINATLVADNKVYDGNTLATGQLALDGVISGDSVNASSAIINFDNKNAGTNKLVTANNIGLSGADSGNYVVNSSASDTADISAKMLTATFIANDKVYDGNTSVTGTMNLSGKVGSDNVATTNASIGFDNKNAGTNKQVTVNGISLIGDDANNYTVNSTATDTADITQKTVTASFDAYNKVYDGNVNATGLLSVSGLINGDNVSASHTSALFNNRNAGTNRTVTVSGISLNGADANNYIVNNTATDLANIDKKVLNITGSSVYNGSTTVSSSRLKLNGLVGSETLSLLGSGVIGNKNVGVAKPFISNTFTIGNGTGLASNYTLVGGTKTVNITPKIITATAIANNKVFDGTTKATLSNLTSSGLIAGDIVSFGFLSANFDSASIGTGKTVTVGGISLTGGADAGNYQLSTTTATTTANITAQ